ncbi:hypothetical protein [Azospirillum formosense]|uniref:hypothetical protein n=1 Tax=Azospirillum formosense TaxID=861533 RepID=UPI0033906AF0
MKLISSKSNIVSNIAKYPNTTKYVGFYPGVFASPIGNDTIDQPDYTPKGNPSLLHLLNIFFKQCVGGSKGVYANTFDIDIRKKENFTQLLLKNAFNKIPGIEDDLKKISNADGFSRICAEQGLFNPFAKYNVLDAAAVEGACLSNNTLFSIFPYNFMTQNQQTAQQKAVELLVDLQKCPNIEKLILCGHSNGGILIYYIAMYLELFIEEGCLDFMMTTETDAEGRQKLSPKGTLRKLTFVDPALRETLKKIIDAGEFYLTSIMSPFKGSEKANLIDFLLSTPLGKLALGGGNMIRSLSGYANEDSLQVPRHLLTEQPLIDKIMDTSGSLIFPDPTIEGMPYSTSSIVNSMSEKTKAKKICIYSDKHMTVDSYALVSQEGGDAPPFYVMPIGEAKGDGTVVATSQILEGVMPSNCIPIEENFRHNELMQNMSTILKYTPGLEDEYKNYLEIKKIISGLE